MIEIKIRIEDIDYDSLADMIAPMLRDRLDSGELPAWARLLYMAGGMNGEAVKKILARIPDEKKEGFIAELLNNKSDITAGFIEEMAATKGIRLKITDVEASQKQGG